MAKERVQVQGLGGAVPGISPTIQRGGQYSVQVQQAGRNKLMDLADALGQVNPILQQYGKLQKVQEQIGIEEAELIEEQNVTKELKRRGGKGGGGFDPLARFNRDRAFRDTLLKRHINNTMLPNLNLKAQDLIDAEKYKTTEEFSNALEASVNEEWEGLVGEVGEGLANTTAGKALWGSVTAPYKNKLRLKYEEAKDAFIADEKVTEMGISFNALFSGGRTVNSKDLQEVIKGYDEALASDLPQLQKKERTALLVQAVKQQAVRLDADKKYDAAFSLLEGVESVKLNGFEVFKGTKALAELNSIRDQVVGKIDSVATQSSAEKRDVLKGRLLSVLASNPIRFEDMPESKIKTLKAAFSTLDPDMDDEEMLTKIQQAFEGPGDFGQNLGNILECIASESDLAAKLYFRINDDILSQWEAIKKAGVTPMQKTDENIAEALEGLERYAIDNPEDPAPWKGYISEQGGRVPKFDELLERSEELAAGVYVLNKDYYKTAGTALRERLKIAEDKITEGIPSITTGSYFPFALSYIKKELRKKAKTIANEDPEVRDAKLEELQRTLLETETSRFDGMAQASTVDFKKTSVTELAGEAAKTMQQKYPTMRPMGERPQFFRRELAIDRQKMVEDRDFIELGLSLTRYGFTSFDPESWKLIQKAGVGIDAADVRLFSHRAEFNNKVDEWKEVVRKDAIRQELTEEEREQRDIYNGFGIYNEASLIDFEDAQSIYYR